VDAYTEQLLMTNGSLCSENAKLKAEVERMKLAITDIVNSHRIQINGLCQEIKELERLKTPVWGEWKGSLNTRFIRLLCCGQCKSPVFLVSVFPFKGRWYHDQRYSKDFNTPELAEAAAMKEVNRIVEKKYGKVKE